MIATLFIRAHERGEKVYLAMMARGYTGTLRSLDNMKIVKRDWIFACISILICLAVLSVEYLHLGG
jgi:cobalt/nickel transport system permease protein